MTTTTRHPSLPTSTAYRWRRFLSMALVLSTTMAHWGIPNSVCADSPRFLFGAPHLVEGISTPGVGEAHASLTPDELEMHFDRYIGGTQAENNFDWDIYVARRDSKTAPFGKPELEGGISGSPAFEEQTDISPDGLTLYYVWGSASNGDIAEIWSATRSSRDQPFSAGRKVLSAAAGVNLVRPSVTSDGLTMYLQRADELGSGVFVSHRASVDASWGELEPVPELVNPGHWYARPFISADGLTLFIYGNDSSSIFDRGNGDLAMLVRSTVGAPWSRPTNLGDAVNSALGTEDFATLSADGKTLYFSRTVSDFQGFDIWQAPVLPFKAIPLEGGNGSYAQDFSSLGTDGTAVGTPLPPGWTFTANDVVFNDATTENAAIRRSYATVSNGGSNNDPDRALVTDTIINQEHGELDLRVAMQDAPVQALELSFDLEVWRVFGSNAAAAFQVILEADSGNGFIKVADLGIVSAPSPLTRPASGSLVNGNDFAYRTTFDSGITPVNVPAGATLRTRWISTNTSRNTRFGVDNVSLRFVAVPEPSDPTLFACAAMVIFGVRPRHSTYMTVSCSAGINVKS